MVGHIEPIENAKEIITSVKGKNLSIQELKEKAIELAALIIKEAPRHQTESEKQQQAQLARMMEDSIGKVFTTAMTDQCFRSHLPTRTADQLIYLIKTMGIPKYLTPSKRLGLRLFNLLGKWMPNLFVSMTKQLLRQEASTVILPGEEEPLLKHMAKRQKEGVRVNLNHLGEAILGEEEATRRLNIYIEDLKKSEVEYISIKISTIYSQINPIAWEHTLDILAGRLRELYRTAQAHLYIRPDGSSVPKFVNLDMEEYKDLHLTVDLFCKVLSEPEFLNHSAGIVLQSYLPEAFPIQQRLTEWAVKRCQNGGAPIKIRIVKGANLSMEQVEASLYNFAQAPYPQKTDVDANFKQMLIFGSRIDHAKAVHLGVASHNVFDSAFALLLRSQNNLEKWVGFEMLEGMADNIRRTLQKIVGEVLLYCPAAKKSEFQNAIAYLIRRLDENTSQDNFLRHLFKLHPGTKEWNIQTNLFENACAAIGNVSNATRRNQDRSKVLPAPDLNSAFDNEPDTDWSLKVNIDWINSILTAWKGHTIPPIPLAINGQRIPPCKDKGIGYDPSAPKSERYCYALGDISQADLAIKTAIEAQKKWKVTSPAERSLILAKIAQQLRLSRGDLLGAMLVDGGKTVQESDTEISEAIDFAEYYRRNIEEIYGLEDIKWEPKGVALVTPPWNFPCSIPAGCILAALATGNSVIFKPAPQTVLVGWQLVQAFWKAGIDEKLLQFFTCTDDPVGSALVQDSRIDVVLLTGATDTAKQFLKLHPGIDLIAETGGKNSIIITSLSDRDLAIKELIKSAFGHAGQKCSACSLAILEAEVYDDPHFMQQLRDAAASLPLGSPWDLSTKVNPLIGNPSAALERGLTELDNGEEWLLKPTQNPDNENLWSPGIKMGVKEGSFMHQTELFGPVLALMRADNLTNAIELANGTPYGLTAGLHSLDKREQLLWMEKIEAGNCYINRGITGAVVQRQPFGGTKQSSFGRGAKAGGPNYLMQLMNATEIALPKEINKLSESISSFANSFPDKALLPEELHLWQQSAGSYAFYWNAYFSKDHDPTQLIGQDNLLRYRPHKSMLLRVNEVDLFVDVLRVAAAAITVGCPLEIRGTESSLKILKSMTWPKEKISIELKEESEEQFCQRLVQGGIERVRLLSPPSNQLLNSAAETACKLHIGPVLANGRVELLHYLREIAFSIDYHRYGYLGMRELETRKPLKQPQRIP